MNTAKTVYPAVKRSWKPADKLAAKLGMSEEQAGECNLAPRYLVMDLTPSEVMDLAMEQAAILANRKMQLGSSDPKHAEANQRKAKANIRKLLDAQTEAMPVDLRGRVRLVGADKPLDAKTRGLFIRVSSLIGRKSEQANAEKREMVIETIQRAAEMGLASDVIVQLAGPAATAAGMGDEELQELVTAALEDL